MEFKNRDLMKPHYSTQILPVPSGPSLYQGSTLQKRAHSKTSIVKMQISEK